MGVPKVSWLRWAGWSTIVAAIVAYLGQLFGPHIERLVAPVWGPAEVFSRTVNADGSVDFRLIGERLRTSCRTTEQTWWEVRGDGILVLAMVRALEDGPTFRPAGRQTGVLWHAPQQGMYVLGLVHDCGLPWPTVAYLGPFKV